MPPLQILHNMDEAIKGVLFVLKVFQKQSHNEIHSLAVRNFGVVHRVSIQYVEQLVISSLVVNLEF